MDKQDIDTPPLMANPAVCGFPSPAEQYVESPLDLNELLVRRPTATFFVRAAGDSMLGAGIRSGDILVVDRSLETADGSIVIAAVDNEFTVKYLRRDGNGVRLEAASREYSPICFSESRLFLPAPLDNTRLRLYFRMRGVTRRRQ